ncbi:MAG TPA: hypothetical protein PKA58_09670 [Polyangium sp.]|nr:hypothetical protein [Polyangium sp.]
MSELGPEAQEILQNGRDGDNPTSADRARIRGALMSAIAAGAAATAAGQAEAAVEIGLPASAGATKPVVTSIFGTVFAKGIAILCLGVAGTGAWLAWPKGNSAQAPRPPPNSEKPVDSAMVATAAPLITPASSAEVAPEKPLAPMPAASTLASVAKPPPAPSTASTAEVDDPVESADSLLAETDRLRKAHGAMREGDPEKALTLLSEQAAEGEGQKLREERSAARVLALCKLGRVAEAQAEAAAFLAQNPQSPLADRVRKACPSSP